MKIFKNKFFYLLTCIFALIILIVSIWSIIYEDQWIQGIIALYGILAIIMVVIVLYFLDKKQLGTRSSVKVFEKTLEGKLHHFKCPNCNGIFAVKKSKRENRKPFTLTCPDCGNVGIIPNTPKIVEDEIPDEKSKKIKFTCTNCGEFISVWAEGTDLKNNVQVFTCPYCGTEKSMTFS